MSAPGYEVPFIAATSLVVVLIFTCMCFFRWFFGWKNLNSSAFDLFSLSWVVAPGNSVKSRPTVVGVLATLCVVPLGALLSYYLWLSYVKSRDIRTAFVSLNELPFISWEFNLTIAAFLTYGPSSASDCEPLVSGTSFQGFNRKDFISSYNMSSQHLCVGSFFYAKDLPTDTTGRLSVNLDLPFIFQQYIVELRSWSPFLRKEYTQQILVKPTSLDKFLQGPTVITIFAQPLEITTAENVSHSGVELSFHNLVTSELPVADGFIIGNTSNVQVQVSVESAAFTAK